MGSMLAQGVEFLRRTKSRVNGMAAGFCGDLVASELLRHEKAFDIQG
jgi:hypothetical protein